MVEKDRDWDAATIRGGIYAYTKKHHRTGQLLELDLLVAVDRAKSYGSWNFVQTLLELLKRVGVREVSADHFADDQGLVEFKYSENDSGGKYLYIHVAPGDLTRDVLLPILQDSLVRQGVIDDEDLLKPIAITSFGELPDLLPVQRLQSDSASVYPERECPQCSTYTRDPQCVCGFKFGID